MFSNFPASFHQCSASLFCGLSKGPVHCSLGSLQFAVDSVALLRIMRLTFRMMGFLNQRTTLYPSESHTVFSQCHASKTKTLYNILYIYIQKQYFTNSFPAFLRLIFFMKLGSKAFVSCFTGEGLGISHKTELSMSYRFSRLQLSKFILLCSNPSSDLSCPTWKPAICQIFSRHAYIFFNTSRPYG